MRDLPRLGFGTAAIGNLYRVVDDAQADATLAAALEGGIRYFDSAPHYGFGLAEHRLARAIAGYSDVILSTKVGRVLVPTDKTGERHGFVDAWPYEPQFDYSHDGVMRSLDASLARLRRERVDILLAHDLGRLTHGARHEAHLRDFLDSGHAAMRALKEEGAVSAIGIGVNEVAICLDLLERVELDVILLAGRYTLLDRAAVARLLPVCEARGVRIIVGGPYNSGILAQPLAEATDIRFNYEAPDADILRRARALEAICAAHGIALPVAALHFPLRHPAVASVIPGMASPAEVADNLARFHAVVPDALWTALEGVFA